MKRSVLAFLVLFLGTYFLLPLEAKADLITITFDDLASSDPWMVVTDQYQSLGVIFSSSGMNGESGHDIAAPGYGEYRGLGGITLDSYCYWPEYIQADFGVPVDFVSVDITPFEDGYEGVDWTLGLELYDGADNLISEDILTMAAPIVIDPLQTYNLVSQSSGPNVAYARFFGFYGESASGVNAVSFDNVTYGTAPVPEPATLLLLATGLIGLAGFRKKFRKG